MNLRKCLWFVLLVIGCGCLSADDTAPTKLERQEFAESLQFGKATILLRHGEFDEFAELVLKDPAIAKRKNSSQITLLHEVAVAGHRESAELLLENGASMECLDIRRLSPFHMAARHNSVFILDLFLEKGADINSWGDVNQTKLYENSHDPRDTGSPLDRAAQIGAARSVEFLLERGAKLDSAPEKLRFTALHHAMTGMWRYEKELMESINESNRIVLGQIADPSKLPTDGNTVVIKMLVEHGADLRAKDYKGDEPLHIAASALDAEAIEFVLKAYQSRLDIDAPNIHGWTPLQVAILSPVQDRPENQERLKKTIATLKKYGARDNR